MTTVVGAANGDETDIHEESAVNDQNRLIDSNTAPILRHRANSKLAKMVVDYATKQGALPSSLSALKSILGVECPPPVASGATLTARENIAAILLDKIVHDPNFAHEDHFSVIIRDVRWKTNWKNGQWDLQAQLKDLGKLNNLGSGSVWVAKPQIAIDDDGSISFYFYYEGIIFPPRNCSVMTGDLEKIRRKLQAIDGISSVSVQPIASTADALRVALCKMWSFSQKDFPPQGSKVSLGRAASRIVHVLATVPLHRLCRGYGQGDFCLRAAVNLMKGVASGSGKISSTNAHPDRRSRDIGQIARETGFLKHKVPWVKLR